MSLIEGGVFECIFGLTYFKIINLKPFPGSMYCGFKCSGRLVSINVGMVALLMNGCVWRISCVVS